MAWLLCSKTIKMWCRFSKCPYTYKFEYLVDGFAVKMSPECMCDGLNADKAYKECCEEMSAVFKKIKNQDDFDAMLRAYDMSR